MARPLPLLGLALALAAGAPAGGAETGRPLTLAEALARAEQQNPRLLAARERARAADERGQAAGRVGWWPRLSLASDWFRTDNPARVFAAKLNRGAFTQEDFAIASLNDPAALSHLSTALSLELPLDVFGKAKGGGEGAQAQARGAAAESDEAVQELRLRVVEAYRRLALAQQAVGVTRRALEGARAREADIGARVAEGAALQADLLRARSRRRQREADLAERDAERRTAQAMLARLVGAPAGEQPEASEAASGPEALPGELPEWTARGLAQRAVLRAARERQGATESAERAEKRALLPDLAVYGQLLDDRGDSAGQTTGAVGVALRWSPFDPQRSKRTAAAEADARASALELRAAEDQVRLEVEVGWRRAQSARERWTAAAGGSEDGREALRVVQERRRAGMATLTDELETDAAALAAELEEMRAAAEAAMADAALRRAAGEL